MSSFIRLASDPLDIRGEGAQQAARDAAELQARQTELGIDEQRRQFDLTRSDLNPWLQAGTSALGQQNALLGLSGEEAQQAAYDAYAESPGQAFLRARGEKALLRNASAIGGLGGGNVRSALQEQGIGFAMQDFNNYYNRLAGLSGTGQQTGGQLGNFGAQSATNIAGLYGQAGQARASGILGAQAAQDQGRDTALQIGGTIASFFSDRNMKENIEDLDLKECYEAVINLPLKSWKYLESTGLDQDIHIGPMIQDAPKAIITDENKINLHDELMLIVGALQYMKKEGLLNAVSN